LSELARGEIDYRQSTRNVRQGALPTIFSVFRSGSAPDISQLGSVVPSNSLSHNGQLVTCRNLPRAGDFLSRIKCRRNRTVFTDQHLTSLEQSFERQKYLSTKDRAVLAAELGLSQIQVKTWYQNRRMKWKKQVCSLLCYGATDLPQHYCL